MFFILWVASIIIALLILRYAFVIDAKKLDSELLYDLADEPAGMVVIGIVMLIPIMNVIFAIIGLVVAYYVSSNRRSLVETVKKILFIKH